ncbi:hypothetical protein HanHA300_Chr15g0572061 [Helianthus annuus]|nr:hypothetical protein HanHA300_Chr15g0572061 [Helianthus annuus]KAJ0473720.1 hypothetical protein HanHA89_Chr15g0621561 [Helianthus annuus]KAJ0649296.1 hypothetical protein HanLR1_Chr15g0582651 [Helianthus annuus]KAJ0653096.1 hypothetical protein HanOQP8_Chr15g0579661 [Helianthus annuus]
MLFRRQIIRVRNYFGNLTLLAYASERKTVSSCSPFSLTVFGFITLGGEIHVTNT